MTDNPHWEASARRLIEETKGDLDTFKPQNDEQWAILATARRMQREEHHG